VRTGAYAENGVLNTHALVPSEANTVDGSIEMVDATPTEFGTFRDTKKVRTAIDQIGHTQANSAIEDTTELVHTQNSNDVTGSPVTGDGEFVQDAAQPTEFPNRWRRVLTVSTAKDVLGGQESETGLESVAQVTHTASSNASTDVAETTGAINSVEVAPTRYHGRFQRVETVRTAKDRTGHTRSNTVLEESTTLLHTQNSNDVSGTPVAGDGQSVEDAAQPTEYPARWRRVTTVRTAKDALGGQEIEAGGEVLVRTTHEASSNNSVDASAGVGFINSVETAPTQYINRWRRVETSRRAKNQYAPANAITGAWTENTATQTHVTSLQAPALVNGQIQTTDAVPTEYGDWRQDVKVRSAINQRGAGITLDASAVANTTIETQAENAVVAQTFVKGHIKEARAEPTDYPNRWRQVVTDSLVLNQNATSNTVTGGYVTMEYANTSAAVEATPAGLTGDGKIVIADNKPTREGNYATTVQVRSAIDRPGLTIAVAADGTETRETNTSSPFVSATPVSTTRYANTIIQTPTEYPGRWEVTNVTSKREMQDSGWFDYSSALTGPSRVRRIKGATREYIDQAIDNMSLLNSISVSPPEVDGFNTYSTVLSETIPLDWGGSPGKLYMDYYDEKPFNIREVEKLYDKRYYRVLNCLHRCAGDTNVANVTDYILPSSINGVEYITLEKSLTHTDAGIYHQGESVLVSNSDYGSAAWIKDTGWPI
jgi:hypothetical protein